MGIPKGSDHEDEAWLLLKYLATNSKAVTQLSLGLRNVPSTTPDREEPALRKDPQFRVFLDVFAQPEVEHAARHRDRGQNQTLFSTLHQQVAGGPRSEQGSAEGARKRGQADRRRRSASRARCRDLGARCGRAPGRVVRGPPAGQAEGGLAPPGSRAPSDESVARRLHGLLRLPARDERVPVVHALRPAVGAALGGHRELQLPVRAGPAGLAGREEHALDDGRLRSAAGAVRVRTRDDADPRAIAASASSARSSTSRRWRRRWRRPSASSTSSTPATGPVNSRARAPRDPGAALVRLAAVGEAFARAPRALGDRDDDDHLSRRAHRRPQAALRVGQPRRGECVAADALGDASVDQPGDPVRGGDRRHRQPAVLHAGLRRCCNRLRSGCLRGARPAPDIRRTRRSSTRCSSTCRRSATSTWATRPR